MSVREQFAANLVRCRKRAGISQEELGFRASLHRTEIGMLERGIRMARIDTLVKLAGALEVEPRELLAGIVWTPADPTKGRFSARYADDDG
ncbi:MAG: helix-turn-helix transcriptional regulator [Thermoleophilia bacterium]|nr:helix-turn-helix transcriptional regulator [Thermoleophilia bacterium]